MKSKMIISVVLTVSMVFGTLSEALVVSAEEIVEETSGDVPVQNLESSEEVSVEEESDAKQIQEQDIEQNIKEGSEDVADGDGQDLIEGTETDVMADDEPIEGDEISHCLIDWNWLDEQGFLTKEEQQWVMVMSGVNEENPIKRDDLLGFLPSQIQAKTEDQEMVLLDLMWDISLVPDVGVEGEYMVTAQLSDPSYSFVESVEALSVKVVLGGAEEYFNLPNPNGSPDGYKQYEVNGVSPNGTKIDLFDYWLTGRTDSDVNDPNWKINRGINNSHALLFRAVGKEDQGSWNSWTKSKAPHTNIVNSTLENGYPKLSVDMDTVVDSNLKDRKGDESLAYLFDPDLVHEGKASYKDVQGLLQVDKEGYYYYNSRKNYAVFRENTNGFTLYDHKGVNPGGADASAVGQFFPFNEVTNKPGSGDSNGLMNIVKSNDASINHYFGLHMSTRFIQQNGGHTAPEGSFNRKPVTYTFSGDDDVWIYIDGKLVADLGGIHDTASVTINFATGNVTINGDDAGYTLGSKLNLSQNTLPDNSYHTLDFFYLERGNVDSNMELRYNLVTIPESNLIKVDQLGNAIPGAEFALLTKQAYDGLENLSNPDAIKTAAVAIGTTNQYGEFVFTKKENVENNTNIPITIDELYEIIKTNEKDPAEDEITDYVLVETVIPEGYRSNGATELYFYKSDKKEILLLSNSTWDKGSYAMSKVTATAPNVIRKADAPNDEVILTGTNAVENPLMFAVVYKRVDDEWRPVYGDPLSGWTVAKDSSWSSVINAVQKNPYIFQLASNGSYQVEISNLPGDVKTYYHIIGDAKMAEYATGYYYTTADILSQATEENTWRIDSDPTTSDSSQYALSRVFSVNLYVSNIQNRLLVQKVDDQSENQETVVGATFSLYTADQVVANKNSKLTLKTDAIPYDTITTQDLDRYKDDGENDTDPDIMNLKGGGIFPSKNGPPLIKGTYYLVETNAPRGYKKNDTIIPVVVDDTGVYVDAGNDVDGVSVRRGVGSIIRSMVQFAEDDDVDRTLNGIKASLVSGQREGDTFKWQSILEDPENNNDWVDGLEDLLHLQYHNNDNLLDYGLYGKKSANTYEAAGTIDDLDSLTLGTETGWSRLLIRQCYRHDESIDTHLKTNIRDRDITALFSGTVTVRVENERTGELKITKTVDGDRYNSKQAFDFKVHVDNVSGAYQMIYQDGKSEEITFTNGDASVQLQDNQNITIQGLPYNAAYKVEEINIPTGYFPSVQVTGNDILDGAVIEGKIPHSTEDSRIETLNYINHWNSLVIDKTVTGAMADRDKEFEFNIRLTLSNGQSVDGTYSYYGLAKDGVSKPNDGELNIVKGNGTIKLKHGQSIAIYGLPLNTNYEISETNAENDGYKIEITSGDNQGDGSPKIANGTFTGKESVQVSFLNSRDDVPTTGYFEDHKPLLISVVACGGLGLLMIIMFGHRRWFSRR